MFICFNLLDDVLYRNNSKGFFEGYNFLFFLLTV